MTIPTESVHPRGTDYAPNQPHFFVQVRRQKVAFSGEGLFVDQDIKTGTVIATDGGLVVTSVEGAPKEYCAIIGPDLFLAPHNFDDPEDVCFINHSCNPNLARIGGLVYVAKKDIQAGSQLTLDYAPLVAGAAEWQMECLCGEPCCRKIITNNDWRDPVIAEQLWAEWLPHIQKDILCK